MEGDVIHPIWFKNPESVTELYGENSYPSTEFASFRIHWLLQPSSSSLAAVRHFLNVIRKGIAIYKETPYDCILCYSHMSNALCGVVIKLFTRSRLVVQIVNEPHNNYLKQEPKLSVKNFILHLYGFSCAYISALASDRLLYIVPNMLKRFPLLRGLPATICPDVPPVPVSDSPPVDESFILSMGYPWYRKGYDVLILAFRKIFSRYPDVKLKIVGFIPDKTYLKRLAGDCESISIMDAVPHTVALDLIRSCTVFAMPSRSEGMGRVLIEAMRYGKPCVGTDTGGIPHMIRDGETGFIVPVDDVDALANKIAELLDNPTLRCEFGEKAKAIADVEFTVDAYVDGMTEAIRLATERA